MSSLRLFVFMQQERKFYKRTLVDCRLKCRKILQISDFFIPSDMNSSVESLRLDFFEKLVRESQCLKKCKSENLEPHMHDSRNSLQPSCNSTSC
jgi:hypothetical protein